jgi:hypothetical protein
MTSYVEDHTTLFTTADSDDTPVEKTTRVRCLRCNRVLKDPVSIEFRMGPICRRRGAA